MSKLIFLTKVFDPSLLATPIKARLPDKFVICASAFSPTLIILSMTLLNSKFFNLLKVPDKSMPSLPIFINLELFICPLPKSISIASPLTSLNETPSML